jgi:hypothetical protein
MGWVSGVRMGLQALPGTRAGLGEGVTDKCKQSSWERRLGVYLLCSVSSSLLHTSVLAPSVPLCVLLLLEVTIVSVL